MSNQYTIGKFGIISEVKKGFVRVSFEEDDIVSNWLPVAVRKSLTDKDSWPYEVQEHVFCMMDERCEYGIVLSAIYNDQDVPDANEGPGKWRKKFSDGTVIEYNKNTHKLTANVVGDIDVTATVKAKVTAPDIELTGAVKITGAAIITGALTAASIATTGAGGAGTITGTGDISTTGDVVAGGKSLKTHTHGGVQTGGGVTGPPN